MKCYDSTAANGYIVGCNWWFSVSCLHYPGTATYYLLIALIISILSCIQHFLRQCYASDIDADGIDNNMHINFITSYQMLW